MRCDSQSKTNLQEFPSVLVMVDLCLCGFTHHGHCGVLHEDNTIDNEASVRRLGEIAVRYAKAGAQVGALASDAHYMLKT